MAPRSELCPLRPICKTAIVPGVPIIYLIEGTYVVTNVVGADLYKVVLLDVVEIQRDVLRPGYAPNNVSEARGNGTNTWPVKVPGGEDYGAMSTKTTEEFGDWSQKEITKYP